VSVLYLDLQHEIQDIYCHGMYTHKIQILYALQHGYLLVKLVGRYDLYFIRYNPDQFEKDGKKHNPGDHKRKSTLIKWIECVKAYAKNGKVKDGLHVLYLFYNGYDEKTTWETIDPFMRIKR
jgi:hypothetical protein